MNTAAKIVVGALVGGVVFGLLATRAEAAPNLGPKVTALLSSSTYQNVLSADPTVDAIYIMEPVTSTDPKASDWAAAEKASGKVVLVPKHFVDGSGHGKGQPTNILGLSRADADALLKTGLYLEAP